jgi:penicillin-binding protein 2
MGVTPLQVTTAFAAVANGGTLYQPQVVKKIIDNDKNVIKDFSPKILRQNFVNPESLKVVREGMRWAVSGEESPQASSVILNSLPVKVAAKTGTAQTSRVEVYDNWVTVFAPYDNPQIVLTILFEDVKNTQMAALPAAKEILNWYFTENIKTTD